MTGHTFRAFSGATLALILSACGDPRDHAEGTAEALADYSVAADEIQKASEVLGGYYGQLCVASPGTFWGIHGQLHGEQVSAVMTIQRQLKHCIEIIQKEPTTEVARMAAYQIQKHEGFMANLPLLRQAWFTARQRMPAQ
jgi:hypothetical protein